MLMTRYPSRFRPTRQLSRVIRMYPLSHVSLLGNLMWLCVGSSEYLSVDQYGGDESTQSRLSGTHPASGVKSSDPILCSLISGAGYPRYFTIGDKSSRILRSPAMVSDAGSVPMYFLTLPHANAPSRRPPTPALMSQTTPPPS